MAGAQADPLKWSMPGWRIEAPYNNAVLVGNWSEERLKYSRNEGLPPNSSYRFDYGKYSGAEPDIATRRRLELQCNRGKGKKMLIDHHGYQYYNPNITWYDQNYNKKEGEPKLPELRKFNTHKMQWWPEKNDFPINGKPTNWGLAPQLKEDAARQLLEMRTFPEYTSTYQSSYCPIPSDLGRMSSSEPRRAAQKDDSTILNKVNLINTDLELRNKTGPPQNKDRMLAHQPAVNQIPITPPTQGMKMIETYHQ